MKTKKAANFKADEFDESIFKRVEILGKIKHFWLEKNKSLRLEKINKFQEKGTNIDS